MPVKGSKVKSQIDANEVKAQKTVIKALGLGGLWAGGNPAAVDIKDGKILRIRPLYYDWKYTKEQLKPWKIEKNGKILEPLMKSLLAPFSLAYKKRVYSPNRIKYPLKRVDWDPKGERNTQNRGKSKFQRITWKEAADLVCSEIRRVHKQYGPLGILLQADGHGECKTVHASHGCPSLLLDLMGGFTQQVRQPDSWEGWYWGAKHVWGEGSVGLMSPQSNLWKDITENTTMLLMWGADPEATCAGYTGQFASRLLYFWSDVGIKQIYVCPDLNHSAAIHADKWVPILPNTDAALQLAIAYIWITEGIYDKEYIDTHSVGFDKFADYVLGKEDGVSKTASWASPKCGVSEWTIKALARNWAKNIVSIGHYFGGSYIRGPYSHEPARLEVILLAMQGLGRPGAHQVQVAYQGMPRNEVDKKMGGKPFFAATAERKIRNPYKTTFMAYAKQIIPKTLIQDAITKGSISWWGTTGQVHPVEEQFIKFSYPISKENGGTEIHMIWTDSPCRLTCWNCGNDTIDALRNPKIECIIAQHPWMENDCLYTDIILPGNTTIEELDIVTNTREGVQMKSVAYQEQGIQPIGESKSDYEIVLELSKNLGMYDKITEGKNVEEWMKDIFHEQGLDNFISWKEFKKNKYYVYPTASDWEDVPAGLYGFYKDPKKSPLPTPSGKLEIYSERLAQNFPDDQERPPIPKWIEKGVTHDERISSKRAKLYPLLVVSNHSRWRVHAQGDDIDWIREIASYKVKGPDNYMYEAVWIHPTDAAKRGIKNGDIVKVLNERGIILGGAVVWERIMPGAISIDHGARADAIIPGEVDRGGAINLISPENITSKNCAGQATSGFLAQVEKLSTEEIEQWKQKYPEAFEREYDPVSGLRFDAWVIEEGGN